MRQEAQNTFTDGLITDLPPLTTPNTVLTDCLNGSTLTNNGDEFVLQKKLGNVKLLKSELTKGYIPIGIKEYGGIIYIASLNPDTGMCEVGSFPAPKSVYENELEENQAKAKFVQTELILDNKSLVSNLKDLRFQHIEVSQDGYEYFDLKPGDKYRLRLSADNSNVAFYGDTRKLYRATFYCKNNKGQLNKLYKDEITIRKPDDTNQGWSYFPKTNSSTISIKYEIENLDVFNINTINREDGIVLSMFGSSISSNKFKGCMIDFVSNGAIVKTASIKHDTDANKTIDVLLSGIDENTVYTLEVTPYSDYNLFLDYKRYTTIINGKSENQTTENSVFRYYASRDNVILDFDLPFTDINTKIYVEAYDVWSDVSTIAKCHNPSQYGINSVSFDLKNEAAIDTFDNYTIGGIGYSDVTSIIDPLYKPRLSSKIRKSQSVRANHFYIVLLTCVVDGVYKSYSYPMYTSGVFNDSYNNTNNFENLSMDIEKLVKIDISTTESTPSISTGNVYTIKGNTTDGKYYKTSEPNAMPVIGYVNGYDINVSKSISITTDVRANMICGKINEPLVSKLVTKPAIETIESTESNDELNKETASSVISSNDRIEFSYSTKRKAYAPDEIKRNLSVGKFKQVSIANCLLYNNFGIDYNNAANYHLGGKEGSSYRNDFRDFNHNCMVALSKYHFVRPGVIIGEPKYVIEENSTQIDGNHVKQHFNKLRGELGSNISAFVATYNQSDYYMENGSTLVPSETMYNNTKLGAADSPWKKCVLIFDKIDANDQADVYRVHNFQEIKKFFDTAMVCSYVSSNSDLCNPNTSQLQTSSSVSEFTHKGASVGVSIKSSTNAALIKTYSKKKGSYVNLINEDISSLIPANSTFVNKIKDVNFPIVNSSNYISTNKDININNYVIDKQVLQEQINLMSSGKDEIAIITSSRPPEGVRHGDVFIPPGKHADIYKLAEVLTSVKKSNRTSFGASEEISQSDILILAKNSPTIRGKYFDKKNGPDLCMHYLY